MRSDELKHHGILGQKWGVRRFQDKNGKLTPAGRQRQKARQRIVRNAKTNDVVNSIAKRLSPTEKYYLNIDHDDRYIHHTEGERICKRIIKKVGDTPVGFIDLYDHEDHLQVGIAVRPGKKYRGKGYATELAQKGYDWYKKNKKRYGYEYIEWNVRRENIASKRVAEKIGLKLGYEGYIDDVYYSPDIPWADNIWGKPDDSKIKKMLNTLKFKKTRSMKR